MKTRWTSLLVLSLVAAISTSAMAQQQRAPTSGSTGRTTGSTGSSAGRTSGASAGSSGMFGTRTFGQGVSSRSSGFAGGGATRGQGGVAGATLQADAAGEIQGSERFLRQNRQQQGFIGNNAQNVQGVLSQLAGGRQGLGSGDQGPRGMQERNDVNQEQGNQNNRQRVYRVGREIAFDYPRAAAPALANTLNRQFEAAATGLQGNGMNGVKITVDSQTAILRGTVASEHDRAVAERLALLEPGIYQVQNELSVAPAARSTQPR